MAIEGNVTCKIDVPAKPAKVGEEITIVSSHNFSLANTGSALAKVPIAWSLVNDGIPQNQSDDVFLKPGEKIAFGRRIVQSHAFGTKGLKKLSATTSCGDQQANIATAAATLTVK